MVGGGNKSHELCLCWFPALIIYYNLVKCHYWGKPNNVRDLFMLFHGFI